MGDQSRKVDPIEEALGNTLIEAQSLPPMDLDEPAVDTEDKSAEIETLNQLLFLRHSEHLFTLLSLSNLRQTMEAVGVSQIECAAVETFLARMPPIEHTEDHKDTFAIFSLLTERLEFAQIIWDSNILANFSFSCISSLTNPELQSFMCSTVLHLMHFALPPDRPQIEGPLQFFYENFFEPFKDLCARDDLFELDCLDLVLCLGGAFASFLLDDDDKRPDLYGLISDLYIRFIHHTDSEISIPAIKGLLQIIQKSDGLLKDHPEFNGERGATLLERLVFLGRQDNSNLCAAVSRLLCPMLTANSYDSDTFSMVSELVYVGLTNPNEEFSKQAVLYVFGTLLGTNDWTRGDSIDDVMDAFISHHDSFRLDEKIESGFVIANALGFLPPDMAVTCLECAPFFAAMLEVLEMDNWALVAAVLNGLAVALSRLQPAGIPRELLEAIVGVLGEIAEDGAPAEVSGPLQTVMKLIDAAHLA
jgi:hypothetical protein